MQRGSDGKQSVPWCILTQMLQQVACSGLYYPLCEEVLAY